MTDTVLDRVALALRAADVYDSNAVAAPLAVLWPDEAGQWSTLIPHLQQRLKIASLGSFDPGSRRGPAYWLRCVIASTIELDAPSDGVPIVYLPGVASDSLRVIDPSSLDLAPLAAVQHRCKVFDNRGRDWTVRSLLSNNERGIGLDIASDSATARALVASLGSLGGQPWSRLESKHIDVDFLNQLLSKDPVRSLLEWLDDSVALRKRLDGAAWTAFVQQCKKDFNFDPASSGEIEGARRLGEGSGMWADVWQRFRENPTDFPRIPERLRAARPDALFTSQSAAWPQDNEAAEDQLRARLLDLEALTPTGARDELSRLEDEHRDRRNSVWAQLGLAPLASSLEHLAAVANVTKSLPAGTSVHSIAEWYASSGWHADRAVLGALGEVSSSEHLAAVAAALIATYRPWLDANARALQSAVGSEANAGTYAATAAPKPVAGEVIVFIDGLRLDVAHLLTEHLAGSGLEAELAHGLAPLPTVTQTSKPALVPIDQTRLTGGSALDARRAPDGPAAGVQVLRSLMADEKVQVLMGEEVGDPSGVAWTEAGQLDSRGHDLGVALALEIDGEVRRIGNRIRQLLASGWNRVTVVTDHGWLLVPGGLPKNEDLPVAVTESKKGRCARVKNGAAVTVPTVPWHWDRDVRIALAPGISCFEANQTYEHGGVSPQECVVPRLTITQQSASFGSAAITSMKWRGLTLVVEVAGLPSGARVDLRLAAGDAGSSIAEMGRVTGGPAKVILLVRDDHEGDVAHLVVVGSEGSVLLQRSTTVGQNR